MLEKINMESSAKVTLGGFLYGWPTEHMSTFHKCIFITMLNPCILSCSLVMLLQSSPKSSNKRSSSPQNSHHPKRQKGNSAEISSADMEMDSDFEAAHSSPGCDSFQFQPPLPPGSPLNATPPPLPRGTPPCTPPNITPPRLSPCIPPPVRRDTPPLTPSSDSAPPRAEGSGMDEDTLTLEELEEQQRLIWAALEQADSANSDSDIPGENPLTGNSVASSPSRVESDTFPEETTSNKLDVSGLGTPGNSEQALKAEGPKQKPISGDELIDLTDNEEANHMDSEGSVDICPSTSASRVSHDDSPVVVSAEVSKNASPVPDMSKFAAGITPFEFDNMAESTGIYLRIRSVLKNSPRNQQKSKKTSF